MSFRSRAFFALLLTLSLLLPILAACGGTSAPPAGGSSEGAPEDSSAPAGDSSGDPAPSPELPLRGELTLLSATGELPEGLGGANPRLLEDGRVALVFAGASEERGLPIDEGCEINYTLTDKGGSTLASGTSRLDAAGIEGLRGEGGYRGVALVLPYDFERGKSVYLSLDFQSESGEEFTVSNAELYRGIYYLGVTPELMDLSDIGVKTTIGRESVTLRGEFDGVALTLNIRLDLWAGRTSPEQIATCARLFFDCYPRMYERFGERVGAPTSVTLAIENTGYEIASTAGAEVHLHDGWLADHRGDFDCLTHEFAHVIQNGWDGDFCEYSSYIERFADYCRFVYAYRDGYYNDNAWTLQPSSAEGTRESSVRFLVWLDAFHSSGDVDLLLRFFDVIYKKKYPAARWDEAWREIFEGTDLAGMTGEEAFSLYQSSDFALASAKASSRGGVSPLLREYGTRAKLKTRDFG